ncbi:Ribulose-5-phosphate 4-epimerase/Fuculose-1-phosphate aldolase [Parasphingorhabdus marina DSM 22363]|uniref:Ribulose-5-phosphate 4-epimerase/Fuculose-1-phosphate aldolase n=1 Tax=Parasphingorhabdus marina DSM 22363 TaxID=1123272 RepID=A0A1N6CV27_9SPHN|nr:class II aldolase/adducin family protein [Parasphingorhabdus marina]SIN62411.1 Ribulose-5-phosphate 4-epimerase/Fuculose-1-phosphate aldolase [Parasphingorhabdus marina DSM 22363]
MATAINVQSSCSEEEWQARQRLAACYRIFAYLGWDEMIFNHITLKVPGEDEAFLINPYGLHFSEVTASTLVKIDIEGNTLDGSTFPVNKAGFTQHSLFHRELPEVHAIIHTHTTATMAVGSVEGGLQPVNFYAAAVVPRLAYHKFEGVTVHADEGPRFLASLGNKRMMMLENHGPVVMGRTLEQAFLDHWVLQRACEIQMQTMAMGKPIMIGEEVIRKHVESLSETAIDPAMMGVPEFDAMVRLVDQQDKSWRE